MLSFATSFIYLQINYCVIFFEYHYFERCGSRGHDAHWDCWAGGLDQLPDSSRTGLMILSLCCSCSFLVLRNTECHWIAYIKRRVSCFAQNVTYSEARIEQILTGSKDHPVFISFSEGDIILELAVNVQSNNALTAAAEIICFRFWCPNFCHVLLFDVTINISYS